ncbi:DUF4325 domain-containing protein [uncultured Zobellia sp.]|uniref:STAS-like domain-containing protein n=1 Tax=uncultured Zobellia sp. TaxID=255433 RepID=UPI00259171D1|nr:DUF4325 domain-containing protein [uncultured Zobellia sp.]
MKTLILRDIVDNSSSVEQGMVLFNHLKSAYNNGHTIILQVDSDLSLSSSFLNSSVGEFLDAYGFSNFRNTLKFKGSKTQFQRFNKYIQEYKDLYLA